MVTNILISKQTNKQTDRQTDTQTNKQTNIAKHAIKNKYKFSLKFTMYFDERLLELQELHSHQSVNLLMGKLKPQSNGLYIAIR